MTRSTAAIRAALDANEAAQERQLKRALELMPMAGKADELAIVTREFNRLEALHSELVEENVEAIAREHAARMRDRERVTQ